jgi:CTP-dependent riboflavin kinase
MIENKKTLFIPDTGVQIVYVKEEGETFGSIEIQKTKIDNSESEIVIDLDFFVDEDTVLMIRDFFIKVSNEWI